MTFKPKLKSRSHSLAPWALLLLLGVSLGIVQLHIAELLPRFFTFSSGVDAKVDLNDGKLILSRWNSNVFLEVGGRLEGLKLSRSILDGDGVELSYGDYDVQVYSLNIDDGGIEYAFVLKTNPSKASIDVPFRSANLDFYYQPPLDRELNVSKYDFVNETHAIKNGLVVESRPENVVGSYAVYHSSKYGNEYGDGKAFHIYRPQLIDANGNKCWATLSITDGVMRIGLDQLWLQNAVYPVLVDPAFGKTAIGASSYYSTTDMIYGTYYLGEFGSLDSISVYIAAGQSTYTNTSEKVCAIYNRISTTTAEYYANTTAVSPTVNASWNTFAINSSSLLGIRSQYYYLFVIGTEANYRYDTYTPTSTWRTAYKAITYDASFAWPSNLAGFTTNVARLMSIFANYTTPFIYTSTYNVVANATYNSTTLISQGSGYDAMWNASSANNYATYSAGRQKSGSIYYVRRTFLFFDCLNQSSYASFLSLKLSFNVTVMSTLASNLSVYAPLAGQYHPTYLCPATEYNYQYYAGGTVLGTNTSGFILNAMNDIVLDVSAINRTAITKLIVRTPSEYSNSSVSTSGNWVESYTIKTPITLTLTYTIPTAPTVEEPTADSPYINTVGNLSAITYADANLSMIVLEDNYTSGSIVQTNMTAPINTTTVIANFTKTWNSSIVTVKWRIWCNDTWGFIGSTEWQYVKIGPQYPKAVAYLASTGTSITNGTGYTQVGVNKNFYNSAPGIAIFNLTSVTAGRQLEFVNITSNSATDLRIYEVVGYYANSSSVYPVGVSFASYYAGGTYSPDKTWDNDINTYWDIPDSSFQPARIRWDFNGSKPFSAIGIYTAAVQAANITVAYINVGNWTGNMTEVGASPVLGGMDYNAVYPSYLNSSGAYRQSDNFTFAPFISSSSNIWAIDFVMNWSTTNTTWLRIDLYSALGKFSADVSPITNASWVLQSITLSYQSEPCIDANGTVVSFYGYNSTNVLIDNCSLLVWYNSLDSVQTDLAIGTVITEWNRPIDVLSPVMHALVFPYFNLADNFYWVTAYDESSLTWINPVNTTIPAPVEGRGDAGHYSPSMGLLPNGSLVLFVTYSSYMKYYITVNSTTTESNITKVLSNWGSVQQVSNDQYSYPYSISFSDRLLVFTRVGAAEWSNMTMFTFNSTGRYEQADIIYTKVAGTDYGYYGGPARISNDKLYFSWVRYNATSGQSDNVYVIVSSDRGSTWTYMNGTACTFPIESTQALVVNEQNTREPYVLDEGNVTTIYYTRFNVTWWDKPASASTYIRYVNGSTLAPNSTITWNSPLTCADEFGTNITGWGSAFYDSTNGKTFMWVRRSRFDALANPYISKYQKTVDNKFFMYLQNSSILNFMATSYLIPKPSVPYEAIGTLGQRGIAGYEATGATQFNLTQGTIYLYPYVASVTTNITHIGIRVNATTDSRIDYLAGHARYYFLYNQNMDLMSYGCYGIDSSYGTLPVDTWEYVPLDMSPASWSNKTGGTNNTGIIAGQTYWIGVIYNDDLSFPTYTVGYFKQSSTTNGRIYANMGKYDGVVNPPSNLGSSEYTNDTGYTLSVFLVSNRVILYGVWDTLTCQIYSMNRTTIAFNTPTAVAFAAQWLDYRGLDQLWFQENSTGSYSTAEYNDTEGASTFWCNRTYTLTITSGTLIDCVMYARNSLGDELAVHLYIRTIAVNLVVGWNNLTTINEDVGHSLGQVCANIQYDLVDARIIVFNNGSEYLYNYGYAANFTASITTIDASLDVYCASSGTWYRGYANFSWRYINVESSHPSSLFNVNHAHGFSFMSSPTFTSVFSTSKGLGYQFSSLPTFSSMLGFSHENVFTPISMANTQSMLNIGQGFDNTFASISSFLSTLFSNKESAFPFFSSTATFTSTFITSKELGFQHASLSTLSSLFSSSQETLFQSLSYLFSSSANPSSTFIFSKELGFSFTSSSLSTGLFSSSRENGFIFMSQPVWNSLLTAQKELAFPFTSLANLNSIFFTDKELGFPFVSTQLFSGLSFFNNEFAYPFTSQPVWSSLFTSSKELTFVNKELSYTFTQQPQWISLFTPLRDYIGQGWGMPVEVSSFWKILGMFSITILCILVPTLYLVHRRRENDED